MSRSAPIFNLRSFRLAITFCFLASLSSIDGAYASIPTRHVILISVDGLGAELLEKVDMPNLKEIRSRGMSAPSAQTTHPVATIPAHVSMATGLTAKTHGFTWNENDENLKAANLPTIFDLLTQNQLESVFITGKEKLARTFSLHAPTRTHLPSSFFLRYTHGRLPSVVTAISKEEIDRKPALLFIHHALADSAGHVFGWESSVQRFVLKQIDNSLGEIFRHAETSYGTDGFVFIVTADHGGHEGSHGRTKADGSLEDEKNDLYIPWIVFGAKLTPNLKSMNVIDTSPSVAAALGLKVPEAWNWEGRSVLQGTK